MSDETTTGPRKPATRFTGPLQRAGGWTFLSIGLGAAVAGAVALAVIPAMTMEPLAPVTELPRLSGIVIDVSGVTPGAEAPRTHVNLSKVRLRVKPDGTDPVWVSLGTGFFVARDLERRCGFGDYNLDQIRGKTVEVVHDGNLQAVELRIGRILCVKAASANRENAISAELRRRGYVYAPILMICGGAMAAMSSLMLGLWDKR